MMMMKMLNYTILETEVVTRKVLEIATRKVLEVTRSVVGFQRRYGGSQTVGFFKTFLIILALSPLTWPHAVTC